MKQYERDYAQRLLNKTSLSQEHEELFLNKLKVECGAQAVTKSVQMVKDIQLSGDLQSDFSKTLGGH